MHKAVLAAALAVVAAGAPALAALNPHVITASGPVTIKRGEEILVALAANPTTGYSWSASVAGNTVVAAEGSAYRAPASRALGAGGEQILAFEARRTGTATITLSYGRPWEKGVKAAQTVVITVTVTQ